MIEYPKLKRLFRRELSVGEAGASEISEAVEAAAKLLGRGKDVGRLQLRLVGGRRRSAFTFDVLGGECRVAEGAAETPNLEIVVPEDALVEIANGRLSPVDAYLTGRMEITGDIEFGKRQYAKLMDRGSLPDLPI
jgi:putative sterol carrier protein